MGGVIFSQVKALIGRTFILAGLAPSALVIVGVFIYLYGVNGVFILVGQFVNKSNANSIDLNILLLAWLLLGVLFVVFRLAIVHFIVELPGILLAPLRYRMEARMLKQRERLFRNKEELLCANTAVNWYKDEFSNPIFIPPFINLPYRKNALSHSGRARRIVKYLMDARYSQFHIPTHWQMKAIKIGLYDLYVYGSIQNSDAGYEYEITEWKELTCNDIVKDILSKVSDSVRRNHAFVLKQYNAYPEDLWIKPTVLGNLVSALDDYSEKRYGIDTATVWPRLWYVISDNERKEIMQSKFHVELIINHMVGFFILLVFSLIVGLFTIIETISFQTELSWWGCVMYSGLVLILTRLTYSGAVFAYSSFNEKTTSLIDLNRLELLKKLGYSPNNIEREIAYFKELRAFFVQAIPRYRNRKIDIKND